MILGKLTLKEMSSVYPQKAKTDKKLLRCFASKTNKEIKDKMDKLVKKRFNTEKYKFKIDWANNKYIFYQ
jgi:hypothetical protein